MALAIQLGGMLRRERFDYGELARLGHVLRTRVVKAAYGRKGRLR